MRPENILYLKLIMIKNKKMGDDKFNETKKLLLECNIGDASRDAFEKNEYEKNNTLNSVNIKYINIFINNIFMGDMDIITDELAIIVKDYCKNF